FVLIVLLFFEAEDGIRHWSVTGVQTCALPISACPDGCPPEGRGHVSRHHPPPNSADYEASGKARVLPAGLPVRAGHRGQPRRQEIGRASCRERGEILVGSVSFMGI